MELKNQTNIKRANLTAECNADRNTGKESAWYRRYVPKGTIYQRGNVFWYAMPIPAGGRKHFSLNTSKRVDAGYMAAKCYRDMLAGNTAAPMETSIDGLLDLFSRHDAKTVKPAYSAARQKAVKNFAEYVKLDMKLIITPQIVNRWTDSLADKYNPKTVKNYRSAACKFCRWLKGRGYIDMNPVLETEPIRVPEIEIIYMQRREMETALAKAEELKLWAVHVAIYTGFRRHEIAGLRWEHIRKSQHGRVIWVLGKGGKQVSLPLHKALPRILGKIKREFGRRDGFDGYIFPRHAVRWWDAYIDPIRPFCPTLQKPGQAWHTFRRTFGSLLTQETGDIAMVSKLMRHSSIAVTMKYYAHLLPEHGRKKLNSL